VPEIFILGRASHLLTLTGLPRREKASLGSAAICRQVGLAFGGIEWAMRKTINPELYLLETYYHLRFRYC